VWWFLLLKLCAWKEPVCVPSRSSFPACPCSLPIANKAIPSPAASYVITDQTELRKIKCMEKTGISITRELMWWWGVRLATVRQLLDLLQALQLYRAAQVILDCE